MFMHLHSFIKDIHWIHLTDSLSLRIQPPAEAVSRLAVHAASVIISLNNTCHGSFKDKRMALSQKLAASYLGSLALGRGHLTSGECSLFWSVWNGCWTLLLYWDQYSLSSPAEMFLQRSSTSSLIRKEEVFLSIQTSQVFLLWSSSYYAMLHCT